MIDITADDGEFVARVGSRDQRGEAVASSRRFSDRDRAIAWAVQQDRAFDEEAQRNLTVARLVMLWHDERASRLRDTTVAREAAMLGKHIARDPFGATDARSLTRAQATAFAQRLQLKDNGRGGVLAPKTTRHVLKALRQSFDASLALDDNVFSRTPLPSLRDSEMGFLSREEIQVLLERRGTHRWGWAFGMILLTGIRRSEYCGLAWDAVDLDRRYIEIRWRRTTAGSLVVEGSPKTRKARRRIPLDPLAVRLLHERQLQRDRDRASWGADWCTDGDRYVWALEDGSLPHPDRLTLEFTKFTQGLGVTSVGLHGLRHSFAAVAIAAGVAPYSLSRAMGHTQVGFTLDRYGHLFDDGLESEMAKVSALLDTA